MDSIISTFHIDWKIIIAQMINFGVVFVVLYIFALKPLNKLMAERKEKIEKGIDDAKTNAAMLKATRVEYDEVIIKARTEANTIFQEGKKEAEARKTLMMEEAKRDVEAMINRGKKMLEAEKVKMVEEAKGEIVSLAMLATRKLFGAKTNGAFNEKTIEELNNLL